MGETWPPIRADNPRWAGRILSCNDVLLITHDEYLQRLTIEPSQGTSEPDSEKPRLNQSWLSIPGQPVQSNVK